MTLECVLYRMCSLQVGILVGEGADIRLREAGTHTHRRPTRDSDTNKCAARLEPLPVAPTRTHHAEDTYL